MAAEDPVLVEVRGRVGVLTLNRPEKANAQNLDLLNALDAGWDRLADDPAVSVIVLKANGKHFSAGHDLDPASNGARGPQGADGTWTVEKMYRWEQRIFLGYSLKWRNCPKPAIAVVQGKCIAAGLMLAWPCDLIVASEDATFSDPVALMGIGGVEYHGHTWEFGARRAKEALFTGRAFTAAEAEAFGMVNHVWKREELEEKAFALADVIAERHPFALLQAKRAVNMTLDISGFQSAIQAAFDIHQNGHGNAISVAGYPSLMGLEGMRDAQK
ncbi:MAG: Enoyl-CoA hydratase/isomerase [Frankiales bacterium]|nr:Enoyl-CoA hydratase/isomerase [Frankiales bacterium]